MKLKRVEIQAFKIYLNKRDGTFDFTVDGAPANIISLYAPNGFGKTSFYDAIDFCFTKNITRFIRDSSSAKQNNEQAKGLNKSGQKQFILRNQYAPDELSTSIEISTTGKPFQSEAINARKNNKDYHFKPENTPLDRVHFRDLLLTQEAIDAFLREAGPEERYQKFMLSQINEQSEYENKRQSIQLILKSLEGRRQGLEIELDKLNEERANVVITPELFETANQLVTGLSQYELPPLDGNFNKETRLILDNRITKYKSELQVSQTRVSKTHLLLETYRNNLQFHKLKQQNILELQLQIATLSQGIANNVAQHSENLAITSATKKLEATQQILESLKPWIGIAPTINTIIEDISGFEDKRSKAQLSLQQLTNDIAEKASKKAQLQQHLKTYKTDINRYDELAERSVLVFKEIVDFGARKSTNEITAKKEKSTVDEIKFEIGNYEEESQAVKQFSLQNSSFVLGSQYAKDSLNDIVVSHNEKLQRISQFEQQKLLTQQKLKEADEQSQSIAELIRVGAEIIAKTEASICPLCQFDYQSFKVLSEKVSTNSSLTDSQQGLMAELQNTQTQITGSQHELADIRKAFIKTRDARVAKIAAVLLDKRKALVEAEKKLKETTFKIESSQKIIQSAREYTLHKSPAELSNFLQTQSTLVLSQMQQIELQLSELNSQILQLDQVSKATQAQIELCATQLSQTKQSEFYLNFQACLKALTLSPQTKMPAFVDVINQSITSTEQQISEIQRKLNQNQVNLAQLINKSKPEFADKSSTELTVVLSSHQEKLTELQNEIEPFIQQVTKLGLTHLLEQANWPAISDGFNAKIDNLSAQLTSHKQINSDLTVLTELFDKVLSYLAQIKVVGETKQLEEDIEKIVSLEIPLKADLQKVVAFLQDKINQYFHTDLINSIYAKIDPHPDFKKVRFACEMPENAKPRLQVYVEDLSGEEVISPTLHFSSAQINVLSLSIFLAKAINTRDSKGEPVDCIFIDDPIQSMDSINVLGTIDLLRNLAVNLDKQIIISTHDENFHGLLKQKIPPNLFNSKFLKLESFGKVAPHEGQFKALPV